MNLRRGSLDRVHSARLSQRGRSRACFLSVVFLVSTMAGSLAFSASAETKVDCRTPGQITPIGSFWQAIEAPEFPPGEAQEITSYAVSPHVPDRLFATNGTSVFRSTDAGCTWLKSFDMEFSFDPSPDKPFNSTTTRIVDIEIPQARNALNTVYLVLNGRADANGVELATGPFLLRSIDGGRTWERADDGLPIAGQPESFVVAPSDPRVAYIAISNAVVDEPDAETPAIVGPSLWATRNAGASWEIVTDVTGDPEQRIKDLIVDPLEPRTLWTYGGPAGCLCVSNDGGRTWDELLSPTGLTTVEVVHAEGEEPRITVFGRNEYFVSDQGGKEDTWITGSLDDDVAYAASSPLEGYLFIATERPGLRGVFALDGDDVWIGVSESSLPAIQDLSFDRAARPTLYGFSEDRIFRYRRDLSFLVSEEEERRLLNVPSIAQGTVGCPPEGPPAQWLPGWDPMPPTHENVYVTNFDTGYTVRFDRFGTGTVVGVAPQYSEGIALDPLGRIIITTRFSDILARLDPVTCQMVALDYDAFFAEGPTYDFRDNSLYITNNGSNYIWRYPWPQVQRGEPELVWRMPGFVEDLKFAPKGHPHEGELFVLYRDRSRDVDDGRVCNGLTASQSCLGGNPNAIRILYQKNNAKGEKEWFTRRPDFAALGPSDSNWARGNNGFQSLGFAFMPDGRLLVPDFSGSGEIRAYSPDGQSYEVFAQVNTVGQRLSLSKIDVTHDGHVYVTAATTDSQCAGGSGENKSFLLRFDSEGNRLQPDFSQNLTCAVGIAVPQIEIPDPAPPVPPEPPEPPVPPEEIEEEIPTPEENEPEPRVGFAAVPPLPPPPPPFLPVPAPAPAPAPLTELAPAPAPNPAPAQAPAANPVPAAVPQQQEQPQMAFVHAAQRLREQVSEEYAMTSLDRGRTRPLDAARYGLALGSLSMIMLFGFARAVLVRAHVPARVRRR